MKEASERAVSVNGLLACHCAPVAALEWRRHSTRGVKCRLNPPLTLIDARSLQMTAPQSVGLRLTTFMPLFATRSAIKHSSHDAYVLTKRYTRYNNNNNNNNEQICIVP